MKTLFSRTMTLSLMTGLWIALVLTGLWQADLYDARPGAAAAPPLDDAGIARPGSGDHRRHLIMVVHPQCSCTRASLDELALLMARSQGRFQATAVFVRYAGTSRQWVMAGLWRQAASIPGVQTIQDPGGHLAHHYGACTSGQTYLYDEHGKLLFSGGLTGARGHEGDNAGYSAALAIIRGRVCAPARYPVFGCSLFPSASRKN